MHLQWKLSFVLIQLCCPHILEMQGTVYGTVYGTESLQGEKGRFEFYLYKEFVTGRATMQTEIFLVAKLKYNR